MTGWECWLCWMLAVNSTMTWPEITLTMPGEKTVHPSWFAKLSRVRIYSVINISIFFSYFKLTLDTQQVAPAPTSINSTNCSTLCRENLLPMTCRLYQDISVKWKLMISLLSVSGGELWLCTRVSWLWFVVAEHLPGPV